MGHHGSCGNPGPGTPTHVISLQSNSVPFAKANELNTGLKWDLKSKPLHVVHGVWYICRFFFYATKELFLHSPFPAVVLLPPFRDEHESGEWTKQGNHQITWREWRGTCWSKHSPIAVPVCPGNKELRERRDKHVRHGRSKVPVSRKYLFEAIRHDSDDAWFLYICRHSIMFKLGLRANLGT